MSTTSEIELKERVAKATGPDRELDGLIEQALGILPSEAYWSTSNVYGEVVAHWISGGYGAYKYHEPEALTASLDAAIALVEMKLPGWGWCCEKTCAGLCRAVVWHPLAKMHDWRANAHTPALALIAALLEALEASKALGVSA